jgi:tripartite-type tricarboxylate transporter receptor subunit TctC
MHIQRRVLLGAALSAVPLARPAFAQPARGGPIRLVVGFPPGGSGDLFARFLAQPLAEELGRAVIVENRPGAAGVTAVEYFLRQPADGSTLMMHTGSSAVSGPITRRNPPYNPITDFAWVALLSYAPFGIALNPRVPAQNLREFVALAKREPGKLTYSSAGIGTTVHLAAEAVNEAAGIEVTHVPYAGSGPAITDTINGTCSANYETYGTLLQHHTAGTLRIIATLDPRRTSVAPDIPTAKEQGWDVTAGTYNLLAAPNGTPRPMMEQLSTAIGRVMARPEQQSQLVTLGITGVTDSGPDQARDFVAAEVARWTPLVRRLGIAL